MQNKISGFDVFQSQKKTFSADVKQIFAHFLLLINNCLIKIYQF